MTNKALRDVYPAAPRGAGTSCRRTGMSSRWPRGRSSHASDTTAKTPAIPWSKVGFEIRYLHRNIAPDTSFNVTSTYYPLLDDFSDYRAESDLTFRREFIEDVYLDLGLNYSYQSNPPSGGAKSDYSVTTSLSYDF